MKEIINILVVDDEPQSVNELIAALKTAGYAVNFAEDGFKALASCRVQPPNFILLDTGMPILSGAEVYKRLASDEKTANLPVIFLGSKNEDAKVIDDKNIQAEDFFLKPTVPREVIARIKSVMQIRQLKDEIRKKEGQIKDLSFVDSITSLKNLRFVQEFLKTETVQCKRYGTPVSLIVLEVDQYREISRNYGPKGLESLAVQIAAVIARQNRAADVLAYSGPLEFTLALPQTDLAGAKHIAERIGTNIGASVFSFAEQTLVITASVGICQFEEGMDLEGKAMVNQCRQLVGKAQTNGGNQIA
jgi:diguanylate cyclase (GGDEF)-like protein